MEYQRITLRIPKDLHEELLRVAEEKSRSMNAEIITRLRGDELPSDIALPEQRLREIIQEELAKQEK